MTTLGNFGNKSPIRLKIPILSLKSKDLFLLIQSHSSSYLHDKGEKKDRKEKRKHFSLKPFKVYFFYKYTFSIEKENPNNINV